MYIRKIERYQSESCTRRVLLFQDAFGCACKFHARSKWIGGYCVFRKEEEEFENKHEECSEGDDFNDGQDVVLEFEKDSEDKPLGAKFLLSALFQLAGF